jgi:aminobenzoyl-glutamate utilization protein B
MICRSLLFLLPLATQPLTSRQPETAALSWIENQEGEITALSDKLWEQAETAHEEARTVKLLTSRLEEDGFEIQTGVAHLPTAFVARRGTGRPVIGIVALLDALPGLSQEAEALERRPLTVDAPGHGCGHHLIAAADTAAALALGKALERSRISGTIKLIGAPAEEIYHGGVFMARAGVFSDLDALLFWHPSTLTTVIGRSGLAMESVKLLFHGLPSDATDAADKGRNALAALERLIAAVETTKARWPAPAIANHVVEPAPGIPSVVPERAAAWYFFHAEDLTGVESIRQQVTELGTRVGIETGTRFELQLLSRTGPWLTNESFSRLLQAVLGRDEEIRYTPEELRLGRSLAATLVPTAEPVFRSQLLPLEFSDRPVLISDDTAEASWLVPRAGFLIACYPSGLPSHSWQWTAAGKSRFAHRGMLRATRALVRAASRLFTDPEALREIREEFERDPRRSGYRSPLPESLGPFDYLRPAKR